MFFDTFYGVFNPKGELEAVEGTPAMADFTAVNLSPDKKNPNRTVEPVTVIRGDPAKAISDTFVEAAHTAHRRRMQQYETARQALADDKAFAHEHKQAMGGNYWHDAHRKEGLARASQGALDAAVEANATLPPVALDE